MSEENYKCEFCKKDFSTKGSLVTHKKTAKYCLSLQGKECIDFSCDFCNKNFTLKQSFQEHSLICKKKQEVDLNTKQSVLQNRIDRLEEQIKDTDEKLKEKDVQLKQKDAYIVKIEDLLKKANETIAEIAKQPKTTNNTDNRVQTQNINFDIDNIAKITSVLENHLTPDVLSRGQEGVADMLKEHLLQSEGKPIYECTDVSRQKFQFHNVHGDIEIDPKANRLIKNLSKSGIFEKAHTNGSKLWTKNGKVDSYRQGVHLPAVTEVLDLDSGDTKKFTKFRSKLASITAKQ